MPMSVFATEGNIFNKHASSPEFNILQLMARSISAYLTLFHDLNLYHSLRVLQPRQGLFPDLTSSHPE